MKQSGEKPCLSVKCVRLLIPTGYLWLTVSIVEQVTHSLSEVTKAWGVNLTRVDIQSVDCSDEVCSGGRWMCCYHDPLLKVRAANTKLVRQRRNAEAMDLQVHDIEISCA